MPSYLHPGVYVEEIPSGARPIETAGTATAAIIGFATKGELKKPTLLFNWQQYQQEFGGIQDYSAMSSGPKIDYMGHTVQAFFNNGGSKAYIVRLADTALTAKAKLVIPLKSATALADIDKFLSIEALNPGEWANDLRVSLTETDAAANPKIYRLDVYRMDADGNKIPFESYAPVTLDSNDQSFAPGVINGASAFIKIKPVTLGDLTDADKQPFMKGVLTTGDFSALTVTDFNGFQTKKIKITLDNKKNSDNTGDANSNELDILFPASIGSLADVRDHIISIVKTNSTSARKDFTCVIEQGRLVMTSGNLAAHAEVKFGAPADSPLPAALADKFIADATSIKGEASFLKSFALESEATLAGGDNGNISKNESDYTDVFAKLKDNRDVNIVVIPDHQYGSSEPISTTILEHAKAHCEVTKNRMVILDPPVDTELKSEIEVKALKLPSSTYTALYYPWVEVANPHFHAEKRPHLNPTYLVPASGFAAGIWAKTDGKRGVWKAPAGLGTGLTGALRTEFVVGNDIQDQLNPLGVNCIRSIISDSVIWGSRTLATRADPEWRYVPVRRTAIMIEESIYRGIQWAVFEPNDHNLWASLRLNIETFMDGLHRVGAFQGQKASDAYFVNCGLDKTMTQGDIDAGRVIVEVGFAPLKPAEFVIVRIMQKTAQL